jgi:KamA family protein
MHISPQRSRPIVVLPAQDPVATWMRTIDGGTAPRLSVYGRSDIDTILCHPRVEHRFSAEEIVAMKAVAAVLPFRVNSYVLGLIDWRRAPDDPIFRLTFPWRDMLAREHCDAMVRLLAQGASPERLRQEALQIYPDLNPHPGLQLHNIPALANGKRLDGLQHKYPETVLFFPRQGQTCHSYCTYCFRWPQFVQIESLKFASGEVQELIDYLRQHPEVETVLFTGGDPMVMTAPVISAYLDPIIEARRNGELPHLSCIRIGSKSLSYWPFRFISDPDAGEILELFRRVTASVEHGGAGLHLAFMAHFSHSHELTPIAGEAIRRLRAAGVEIRTQAPVIRGVNDRADVWADMWRRQVQLGLVPYYMFIERNTGARGAFELPLAQAYNIYRAATAAVSGLARTARGCSMSTTAGKVAIRGVRAIHGEEVFALEFLQARNPEAVGVPFYARFDRHATWLDDLAPASFERGDLPLPWREVLKWRNIEARESTEVRPLARAGNCR